MWFIAATSHRVAGIEIFSIPATYVRTTYVGLASICELGFKLARKAYVVGRSPTFAY